MSGKKRPTTEPEQRIYAFDKLYELLREIKLCEAAVAELNERSMVTLNQVQVTNSKLATRLSAAITTAITKVKHELVDDLRAYPVPPEMM